MADEPRNESQEEQQPQEQQAEPEQAQPEQPQAEEAPAAEATQAEAASAEPAKTEPAPAKPAAKSPEPSKKSGGRGCSLFAWIVVLAVILAVAAYLVHRAQVEEQRRKQEELAQRRAVRETQIANIGDDIAKALQVAQEGDIAKTLMILEAQENLLATIAREASASGDAEDAQRIVEYKAAVSQVADAIRQKQEELRTFVIQQISSLGTKFPQVQRAATAIEEPSAEEQPQQEAQPEQGAGGEEEQPAPAAEAGGSEQPQAEQQPEQPAGGAAEQPTPQEIGP